MANSEIKMSMSLNTAKVTTALGKMKTGIANFSSSALNKLGSVSKMATGALVAGFTVASKAALEYAKNLDMFAQVSNTTSEEFQYLAAGAREVGIENEKLADIFKDVSDKMGDFLETGGGPMADFFENIAPAIGVTAKEFENLSGPQILQKYYNSLEKANLSQADMIFYLEAIGSDASRLQPKLKNLGAGFKEAGDRAKEMGLIMDDFTKDSLKKANTAIDEFKLKMTIAAGETLMGFQIMAKASKDVDFLSGAKGLGELILGITTSNLAAVKSGAKDIEGFFVGMDQSAEKTYKAMYGDTQNFEADFSDISNNIENKWIDTTTSITEENRKTAEKGAKEYEKWSTVFDKITDERSKRAASEMTAQEELNSVVKERLALEEDLATFRSGVDPFSAEGLKKELEVEKLLTKEQKLQVEVGNEAAEADEVAIQAKLNKLDLELQIAKASGDPNRIAAAQKELDTETQIVALMNQHKISRDEATKILGNQNAHLETQKDLELQLLMAQANGNDALARELQGRIDKEKEALDIMEKFGISIEKARVIAAKLAGINAGPDLNQSGFTTNREQREFDRQQKIRQRAVDQGIAVEKNEEALLGGGLLGKRIPRDKGGEARAADRKEDRARRADIAEAQKRMQRGEDAGELMQEMNERRAGRQEVIAKKQVEKPMTNLERQAAKNKALAERRETDKRLKAGENLEDIQKDIAKRNAPKIDDGGDPNAPGKGGGDPNAPGGGGGDPNAPGKGGGGPAEPKKPVNPVVAGLGPKLDDIKTELVKIEKHLQC